MSSARRVEANAEDVERQLKDIQEEVTAAPLLSHPETLSLACRLAAEFQHDDVYYSQVLSLFNSDVEDGASERDHVLFKSIRYARRDGNCFYRCASFRMFELMLTDHSYADLCLARVEGVEAPMLSFFGEYSADFSDVVKDIIGKVKRGVLKSRADLYDAVVASEEASYIIVFFRYAVSIYLREHSTEFLPFVMGLGYGTVEGYCSAEVEPVDHESDNVQLVAFAKLFQLVMHVETLDRTSTGRRITHVIYSARDASEGQRPAHVVYLLFRPGHYDLLEPRSSEDA